jgi:hypothetical protein
VQEICGRYIGTQTMIEMKKQPAPAEEEKKPKATGKDIFTDAPAPGDEAAPVEGGTPPAEGEPAPEQAPETPKP